MSVDLATALAARLGRPLTLAPEASPPAVIAAVQKGRADIGFVAYEATRVGAAAFSQTYMATQQTFLVRGDSALTSAGAVDRAGLRVAGTRNDSITLCLKRILKAATLVELDNDPALLAKALATGEIDALGANRQRLTTLAAAVPGARVLPDTLFSVPQNVVVAHDDAALLGAVDATIDAMRASGALALSVAQSGVVGVEAASPGPVSRFGCPG